MKPVKNIPASVRQRLLNRARAEQSPFNELLQYYAMERFLYRYSNSSHSGIFILKGALLLRAWRVSDYRPTMDIDLLGRTGNSEANIAARIRDIVSVEDESDGLTFQAESIRLETVDEDSEYEGTRVLFDAELDRARIHMQIDIGFSDIIHPEPEVCELPVLLDHPPPRLPCYTRESVIAEKFEAMVKRGMLNSRMKDFHDIWLLPREFDFDGARLAEAIRRTFQRRGTSLSGDVEAFSAEFIMSKQAQWAAFRRRLRNSTIPDSFVEVVDAVGRFLDPISKALSREGVSAGKWIAPGPWK